MESKIKEALHQQPAIKAFRESLLADPDRPGFHFCDPEGWGMPGDPNGCFYANGKRPEMKPFAFSMRWG